MAAAAMFATSARRKVMQFTIPFMTVQATIVIRKPNRFNIKHPRDLLKRSDLKFGILRNGMTSRVFRKTKIGLYNSLWRRINSIPNSLTSSNQEGLRRVRNENFAYIMPNSIAQYVAVRWPCNLQLVGNFLLNEGFGFAFPKNSRDVPKFNRIIEKFKRRGIIQQLKKKWWNDTASCSDTSRHYRTASFNRKNNSSTRDLKKQLNYILTAIILVSYSLL